MENLNPRSDLLSILGHALVLVGFSFLLGMNIALWGDEQPEDGDEVGSTRATILLQTKLIEISDLCLYHLLRRKYTVSLCCGEFHWTASRKAREMEDILTTRQFGMRSHRVGLEVQA
uniref:Uncharacterized protein n=1 Tax=Pristionchus pacificus TaxID=54126 RepID=A0A2A6CBE0_PRIPA|eukprot:PDM75449.1 hypothetical protein PRIPAC_42626 [Pristionchus pacificus]